MRYAVDMYTKPRFRHSKQLPRTGVRAITVRLTPEQYLSLKRFCFERDVTVRDLLSNFLRSIRPHQNSGATNET